MKIINKIYEHLKTKKKYNTLQIKYETKCDELEQKIVQYNTERRIKIKQMDLYETRIKELTETNMTLQEEITKLKKENKEIKKGDKDGTRTTRSKTRVKKDI